VSNLRVFWFVWCSMWALGWLLMGFFTLGLAWLFVPLSLVAILVPIGRDTAAAIPPPPFGPCFRCGAPAGSHGFDGSCPVSIGQ
jgi:uncharacterized SAM-binding protein YcdF (DUF218 family)